MFVTAACPWGCGFVARRLREFPDAGSLAVSQGILTGVWILACIDMVVDNSKPRTKAFVFGVRLVLVSSALCFGSKLQ